MASIRNNFTVSTKRGGTYVVSTDPTDLAVYTSVFLTEHERRFFVDNLETKSVEFSAGANCQMFCKTLMHDISKPSNHTYPDDAGCATVPVGKETILCLHPLRKVTSSWAWVKFAVTLFRQGFNVVMVDLPGFGKSSIGRDVRCSTQTWRPWEVTMVTILLQKLHISKVNILAGYESASILFDIIHESPNLLGRNHILYNPIIESGPGNSEALGSHIIKGLLTSGLRRRVFVTFDRNQQLVTDSPMGSAPDTEFVEQLLNSERMFRRVSKAVGFRQVIVSSISSLDLAEVCLYDSVNQPGVRPIYTFYPSKAFRIYSCQFMAGESLIEYEPAVSLADNAVFQVTMDGATPRLTARSSRRIGTVSQRSLGLPPQSSRINNYSYGVRVRNMEEDLIMEIAIKESEHSYLHDHDTSELKRQQKISDSFSGNPEDLVLNHRDIIIDTVNQGNPNSDHHARRLLSVYASEYQQNVEDALSIDYPSNKGLGKVPLIPKTNS